LGKNPNRGLELMTNFMFTVFLLLIAWAVVSSYILI